LKVLGALGNLIDSTGTSDNTYGFTGEQQFEEADYLVFLRARYYDPRVGRFISREPLLSLDYYAIRGMDLQKFREWQKIVKPGWLNPYVYCLNNPVNLVDPTGGCSSEVPDEIAKEVIKEVIDKYGSFALDELKNACLKHESGCGTMADCQTCGDYKCLMKIPVTLVAFHKCIKAEYLKCF
jgi:RHS repeat-associated protein